MHAPLIAFAWRAATLELVGVAQVERGLDCDCICPACQGKLIARQGDILQWHFAHAAGDERPDCFLTGYSVAMQTLIWRYLAGRRVPQPPKLSLQVTPQGGVTGIRETVDYQAAWRGEPGIPSVINNSGAHPLPGSVSAELQSGEVVRISLSLDPSQLPSAPSIGGGELVFAVPPLPNSAISTEAAMAHIEQHGRWRWVSHPDIGGALQRARATVKRRVEEHRHQVAQRWTPRDAAGVAGLAHIDASQPSRTQPTAAGSAHPSPGFDLRQQAPAGPAPDIADPSWMVGRPPKAPVIAWLVNGRVWLGYELLRSSSYRLIPWGGATEGCWAETGLQHHFDIQARDFLDLDAATVVGFMGARTTATFVSSDIRQLEAWARTWQVA